MHHCKLGLWWVGFCIVASQAVFDEWVCVLLQAKLRLWFCLRTHFKIPHLLQGKLFYKFLCEIAAGNLLLAQPLVHVCVCVCMLVCVCVCVCVRACVCMRTYVHTHLLQARMSVTCLCAGLQVKSSLSEVSFGTFGKPVLSFLSYTVDKSLMCVFTFVQLLPAELMLW